MRFASLVLAGCTLAGCALAGCAGDARLEGDAQDADAVPADGLPLYDPSTHLLRGPFLQLPTPTSMTILWATDLPATSRVEWGVGAYDNVTVGRTWRYGYGVDGNPPSGWLHQVTLTGLQPATSYHYRVASLAEPTLDAEFHTAPLPGESFRVALWGDTRYDDAAHASVVEAIQAQAPDVGIFSGDFTNSGGDDDLWTNWFAIEKDLIARVPILPAIGNHELGNYKGGARYDQTFVGPETAVDDFYGDKSARMYSFDYGSLHVLVVDPYTSAWAMTLFASADLASPAARAAKFRIMVLHPNLYTFSFHRADGVLRDLLLPLARGGGVQVIVTGHNHCYERFWLGDIHQLTLGGGGAALHDLNLTSGPSGRPPDDPSLRVAANKEHSYAIADVDGNVATFHVLRPDGTELDCFQVDATQDPPQNLACPQPRVSGAWGRRASGPDR